MIASLTGHVTHVESDRCVIDVHGVGYLIQVSARVMATLHMSPDVTNLLTEMVVRQDSIALFGFATIAERDWFRLLTQIQGVGSKVALAILSAFSTDQLYHIVCTGDKAGLTAANGVGFKLAARIITELQDKTGSLPVGKDSTRSVLPASQSTEVDAIAALEALGFNRMEVVPILRKLLADITESPPALSDLVSRTLKELGR